MLVRGLRTLVVQRAGGSRLRLTRGRVSDVDERTAEELVAAGHAELADIDLRPKRRGRRQATRGRARTATPDGSAAGAAE